MTYRSSSHGPSRSGRSTLRRRDGTGQTRRAWVGGRRIRPYGGGGDDGSITAAFPALRGGPRRGFKDTTKANPGYFTTIRGQFDLPDGVTAPQTYVHHCHIVEHEDNDMMRPFTVNP